MDPDAPRKVADPQDLERLHRVQRRVVSVLVMTTLVHLTAGFVLLAKYEVNDEAVAQVVLIVIGALFWVFGVASTLVINKRPWLSPWLLTGLLPLAAGLWWVFLA